MKVLMWLSIGLDKRSPSRHLLSAVVEALYKQGHTVHILQKNTGGDQNPLTQEMLDCNATTTCINMPEAKKNNFIGRYLNDLKYVWLCKKYLKDKEFDRVFLQSSNVAGFQVKVVEKYEVSSSITFNVQDVFPQNAMYSKKLKANSIAYKILKRTQNYAYKKATNIITISPDMKKELSNSGVDANKISVIYNWSYQDGVYAPEKTRNEQVDLLLPKEQFNVVYAGNIGLMQNVEVVLNAAKEMQRYEDIRFHIIGNGLYREKLENMVAEWKLRNVSFHNMLHAELAPSIYCRADINVIPLAENIYRTALPSKTATCLASQKPVIFAIGNDTEFGRIVHDATGAPVVDSNDFSQLIAVIIAFYSGEIKYNAVNFYLKEFQKSRNSMRYAEIICS